MSDKEWLKRNKKLYKRQLIFASLMVLIGLMLAFGLYRFISPDSVQLAIVNGIAFIAIFIIGYRSWGKYIDILITAACMKKVLKMFPDKYSLKDLKKKKRKAIVADMRYQSRIFMFAGIAIAIFMALVTIFMLADQVSLFALLLINITVFFYSSLLSLLAFNGMIPVPGDF